MLITSEDDDTPDISRESIPSLNPNYREFEFKVVIIGDYNVGKTAVVRRYSKGIFSPSYKLTIGVDFSIKTFMLDVDTKVKVQLWDIAGHERFGYTTRIYYKYANAAIVVFDITRPETMNSVKKWIHDLRTKMVQSNGTAIPILLLANKWDLKNTCEVNEKKISDLCRELKIHTWYPTSARDGFNIEAAFDTLIDISITNKLNEEQAMLNNYLSFKLGSQSGVSKVKSKCC